MKDKLKQAEYTWRLFVTVDAQESVETAAASFWNAINRRKKKKIERQLQEMLFHFLKCKSIMQAKG